MAQNKRATPAPHRPAANRTPANLRTPAAKRDSREQARALMAEQQRAERRRGNLIKAGIAVVAVIVAIGILVGVKLSSSPKKSAPATVAGASLMAQVTGVPAATLDAIGKGQVNPLPTAKSGNAVRMVDGKPLILYVGGEFCPFCAAERWAMIVALSRFGTFSNVSQIYSNEDNIPTFSFHGSTYTSDYVTFQPMEINGNSKGDSPNGWAPLETLTPDQTSIFQKFNSDGAFPFMDFADQAVVVGSSYSPALLEGKTQAQVAAQLTDTSSAIAKAVGGTANAFTAQICKLTNDQPGTVCSTTAAKAYSNG